MGDSERRIYFNGINVATGTYHLPPLTDDGFLDIARRDRSDRELLDWLTAWAKDWVSDEPEDPFRAPIHDCKDHSDLSQTGWAIVFPEGFDPDVEDAMSELLEHRGDEAGNYYQKYTYLSGESVSDFLKRQLADLDGPVNPERVPYYVLLVGDPETIPFQFQYELDVQYAVGRIHFENLQDYYHYSRNVVRSEQFAGKRSNRVSFFGVKNHRDRATMRTAEDLVVPLANSIAAHDSCWKVDRWLESQATRPRLESLLSGSEVPALLFAACHGMVFPLGDPRQIDQQGALLCQEWPNDGNPVRREHYLAAEDVASDADLSGLIAFFFACHSAGTPRIDTFSRRLFSGPGEIAPCDFVSRLPQRMLGHPKGGALAVVGNIDRGWTTAFQPQGQGNQINAFDSTLKALLDGWRLGHAMNYLNVRYAQLGAKLGNLYVKHDQGQIVSASEFSYVWRSAHDARNLIVFGDPAVRLSAQDAWT